MRYFPILDMLLGAAENLLIPFFGLVFALAVGAVVRDRKKCLRGALVNLLIYAACEVLCQVRIPSYGLGIISLFVGIAALGASAGFLLGAALYRRKM